MRTFNIICTRIDDAWQIVKTSNSDVFPVGLLILSEKTSREMMFLKNGAKLGPPFFDISFENILKNLDTNEHIKERLNSRMYYKKTIFDTEGFQTVSDNEFVIYPIKISIEKYICEEYDHCLMLSITLHELNDRRRVDKDDSGTIKLELWVESINSKLEELLDNIFYSNNSMLSRIIDLENKSDRIEKDEYITKKEFTTIGLFFRSGFINFIFFIFILITFNEIINDGFLRGARITDYIRQHLHIQDD